MEIWRCNSYFESRWIDAVSSRLKESLGVCVGVFCRPLAIRKINGHCTKNPGVSKFRKLSFVYRIFRILGKDAISGGEKEVLDSKLL
jgi:hypothetical protein